MSAVAVRRLSRPGAAYTGFAAPFLLSSLQDRSGLAPADLLVAMAGLAALTAVFLALGGAASRPRRPQIQHSRRSAAIPQP